jgi:hypothetical protein
MIELLYFELLVALREHAPPEEDTGERRDDADAAPAEASPGFWQRLVGYLPSPGASQAILVRQDALCKTVGRDPAGEAS